MILTTECHKKILTRAVYVILVRLEPWLHRQLTITDCLQVLFFNVFCCLFVLFFCFVLFCFSILYEACIREGCSDDYLQYLC